MASRAPEPRPVARRRQTRLILYLVVLLGIAGWRFLPRPWHPTQTLETERHRILSTATKEETAEVAHALPLLYAAYSNRFGSVGGFRADHPKLTVKLYRDRDELRRIHPGLGWAEAFYSPPVSHAYFARVEINPLHWLLHESVHQLNHEVAHLHLENWLDEGLATYFGTSRLDSTELAPGQIDPNTYPVWWMDELATRTNLAENLANGSVIPLRAIITGRGGPRMNTRFNLYYLHWWSLAHFLLESEAHRTNALRLVQRGGDLASFEELIGPAEQVQLEWHTHVQRLKVLLSAPPSPIRARQGNRTVPQRP